MTNGADPSLPEKIATATSAVTATLGEIAKYFVNSTQAWKTVRFGMGCATLVASVSIITLGVVSVQNERPAWLQVVLALIALPSIAGVVGRKLGAKLIAWATERANRK